MLLLCIGFLQGCSEKESGNDTVKQDVDSEIRADSGEVGKLANPVKPSILLDNNAFHSVVGWMSNDEIVFVIVEKGQWMIRTYTVSTASWRTIYSTTTPIIQATIHPSKEMILLHTSKDSSSAEIQFLHKNGYIIQSLSFESAEIYMDWHPTNPNLVVFSPFYEDWTYNTFVYDGATQDLTSIEIENPFVKWYDEENLMVFRWSDSALDGSELFLYSNIDGTLKSTGEEKILDVTNIGEALLYVQINEENKQFEYRLEENNGIREFKWATPAVSNYSEWVIPSFSIVSPQELLLLNAKESRNQDDPSQKSILSKISLGGQNILGEVEEQSITCSPNANICLGGYTKDNWIQVEPLKVEKWIYLNE